METKILNQRGLDLDYPSNAQMDNLHEYYYGH